MWDEMEWSQKLMQMAISAANPNLLMPDHFGSNNQVMRTKEVTTKDVRCVDITQGEYALCMLIHIGMYICMRICYTYMHVYIKVYRVDTLLQLTHFYIGPVESV